MSPTDVILRLFPDAKFIYLQRKDTVNQAVSLYFAMKTGLWAIRNNEHKQISASTKAPPFSFMEIFKLRQMIRESNAVWEAFFNKAKIECYSLYFEQFLADKEAILRSLLEYIGVPTREGLPVKSTMQKQSTDISSIYVKRYKRMAPYLELLARQCRNLCNSSRPSRPLLCTFFEK